jgi:hypothetical protein
MTWARQCTLLTTATPEQLWARWTTPEYWPADDPAVQWVVFDAPAATGATGKVKNAGSPAQRFRFTDVRVHDRMDLEIRLPLATLSITHAMQQTTAGLQITHGIVLEGPLAAVYGAALGRGLAAALPDVVRRVADGALTL